jgi:DNA-binding FadR family transcriptional regulator
VIEPLQSIDRTSYAPLEQPQRYERIAARLAADIRAGRLAPGERLPSERELARRLAVGRASVREALAALALEGVLETRPGSGSFVAADVRERLDGDGRASGRLDDSPGAARSPDDWRAGAGAADASPSDLLEARLLLEPRVARLAAGNGRPDAEAERLLDAMEAAPGDRAAWNDADRRFHHRIAALAGNAVLLALADRIAALMDQPLWQRLRDESVAEPGRARIHTAEHRLIYQAVVDRDGDAAEFHAHRHLERVRRYMTLEQE